MRSCHRCRCTCEGKITWQHLEVDASYLQFSSRHPVSVKIADVRHTIHAQNRDALPSHPAGRLLCPTSQRGALWQSGSPNGVGICRLWCTAMPLQLCALYCVLHCTLLHTHIIPHPCPNTPPPNARPILTPPYHTPSHPIWQSRIEPAQDVRDSASYIGNQSAHKVFTYISS